MNLLRNRSLTKIEDVLAVIAVLLILCAIVAGVLALIIWLGWALWGWLAPLFNLPILTYWQFAGLWLLIKIFVGITWSYTRGGD